jgi:hypothetical protein
MIASARLLSPDPAILDQCRLEATIDLLRIDCPPSLVTALMGQIDRLTPCRLEVLRVEIWVTDRLYAWFSVDSLIRSKCCPTPRPLINRRLAVLDRRDNIHRQDCG